MEIQMIEISGIEWHVSNDILDIALLHLYWSEELHQFLFGDGSIFIQLLR